jgi:trans-aconitate methyltransferase
MSSSYHQHWDPERYARNARFVAELGLPVVALLAPQPGERVLDLGCGDGALSVHLLDSGCSVVGVDASAEMVAAARGLGLDARVVDGHALRFEHEFDAVFSNAALHWMPEPARVVAGVWHALKPGGRFVGEFGGYGNVETVLAALDAALRDRGKAVSRPWYFPRAEEYRELLEAAGFRVNSIGLLPRPTVLPGGMGGWLETFAQPWFQALADEERQGFLSEVVETLREKHCDASGVWTVDYVRLRFSAAKPDTAAPGR